MILNEHYMAYLARELQIQDDIVTFDALLRKSTFRFIDPCRKSDNSLTRYTVKSS